MNEMKLPWQERGKLWARLGIRLAEQLRAAVEKEEPVG